MSGRAIVRRILPNGIVFFAVWPLFSTVAATLDLKSQPMTSLLPWSATFAMLMRAQTRLLGEWLWVGTLGAILSIVAFSSVSRDDSRPAPATVLALEPFLVMLAALGGIATEYPAVLAHPFLRSLGGLSVRAAILVLIASALGLFLLCGLRFAGARGGAAGFVAGAGIFLAAALAARLPARRRAGSPSRGSIALVGIDSVSQSDDLEPIRDFTRNHGGTFFVHAATTGVVTNAVWGSILQHRPVHDIAGWTIFVPTDWPRAPFNLVRAAHRSGRTTVSYFSDQFTSYVGSEAGFDIDRSGPTGWMQLATATLKQNSVFLAFCLPRLPQLPAAGTPRNQSGTFAFDLAAELDDLLSTPHGAPRSFSAGHLDYLHQPLYPRFSELTPSERAIVLRSPATAVQDQSFDWRYPAIAGDALGLYGWKVRHVQRVVADAVARSGFLDPARANRLVLFSDHGSRKDLTSANFGNPVYWNVLLAAFGCESRDPARPISLLEIPALLGLADPTRPDSDTVELDYADVQNEDIGSLAPLFAADGRIFLDPRALSRIRGNMRSYLPFRPSDR